jgi:hypothetical protein
MTAAVWEICYDKLQREKEMNLGSGKGRKVMHEEIWSLELAKEQLIFTYSLLYYGCKQCLFRH